MPPRRVALQVLFGVGAAACAGAAAGPAIRFALGTSDSVDAGPRFVRVLRLEDLRDETPKRVEVVGDRVDGFTLLRNVTLGTVWLRRQGEAVVALSDACPHLGCSVRYSSEARQFACPCHAARFELDGRRVKGPAPRGMDALDVRIDDGWIAVDFRRFRAGTSERIET
jgi:menaquinol-cytochrome c reductase iron-sulfur subunit